MADAKRDNNRVTTLLGVDLQDLTTPAKVVIDSGRLMTTTIVTNQALQPGVDFDFVDVQQTSATVETFVHKLGGSGGTTVLTTVVTYTDATKADINTVEYTTP